MSCRRRLGSLGGTHGLAQNLLPKLRLQRIARDQIDGATEQGLQTPTEAGELEERHGRVEVHEDVDVAARLQLLAGCGTEQPQFLDGVCPQLRGRRSIRAKTSSLAIIDTSRQS